MPLIISSKRCKRKRQGSTGAVRAESGEHNRVVRHVEQHRHRQYRRQAIVLQGRRSHRQHGPRDTAGKSLAGTSAFTISPGGKTIAPA